MRLNDEKYEEIKSCVVSNLKLYGIGRWPIDLVLLCKKLGLTIVKYNKEETKIRDSHLLISDDGYLDCINNTIYLNDSINVHRERFTLAHEIAHYLLGHVDEGEEEEAESNYFAAYMLAPPPIVHINERVKDVFSLSEEFNISYEAALNSARRYGLWKNNVNRAGLANYDIKLLCLISNKYNKLKVGDSIEILNKIKHA